ncbi:ankyrin repeat domain-containing protein 10a isoform X3 [Xyrauchen texanus]|uniref:ankyrin repeat domain-containing protein 10a isoform X3 n=1 Tax=Xyrauchen texanus TaxID=154827 RepID=UPI002241E0B1|nr:ankyrin repeat domain-containing protein 10a isoform X3 [Xyrauchen texanus]
MSKTLTGCSAYFTRDYSSSSLDPASLGAKEATHPPQRLHQICQFLLQGTCKFLDISGGNGPSPHPLIQQDPDVHNRIEIRALRWP